MYIWTIHTKSTVLAMDADLVARLENQGKSMQPLQNALHKLIPRLNPERKAILVTLNEELPKQLTLIDDSGLLHQELVSSLLKTSQAVPLVKRLEYSTRLFSPSFIDKRYVNDTAGEISSLFCHACEIVTRKAPFKLFSQFRGLEDNFSNKNQSKSVQDTVRILKLLRSDEEIPDIDTAKNLLRLGGALWSLQMSHEATMMYDWGVQICWKLAELGDAGDLVDLAKFLHKLALGLDSAEQVEEAERVFERA
ncbi:hypothetical protein FRC02_000268, partial [Tulasnella sp. 418]